jgi:uncharacterized DUF497 family protein
LYYSVLHHHTRITEECNTREIYFLLWDEDNEQHIAGHGITPAEVREMLSNRHLTMSNPHAEGRITLIGVTNGGRVLSVALDPTHDSGTWRPVTAVIAPAQDRRLFDRYCR